MKTDETTESLPSGKLLVRMPRTLHADLARAADSEGVSLNQLIVGALTSAVAWRRPGGAAPRAAAGRCPSAPSARAGGAWRPRPAPPAGPAAWVVGGGGALFRRPRL